MYTGLVFNEWSALLWQAGTGCLSVGGGASHVPRGRALCHVSPLRLACWCAGVQVITGMNLIEAIGT